MGKDCACPLCGSGARVFLVRRFVSGYSSWAWVFACLSVVPSARVFSAMEIPSVAVLSWWVDAPCFSAVALRAVAIPQVQFFVLLMTCLSLHNDRCRVRQCRSVLVTAVCVSRSFPRRGRRGMVPWSRLSFDHGHSPVAVHDGRCPCYADGMKLALLRW